MRVVRFSSLSDVEEQILIAAVDSKGNVLDDDFAQRLLTVPFLNHTELNDVEIDNQLILDVLQIKQTALIEKLELRNADIVTDEILKIENWAEDNRKELQHNLTDLDKEIEDKNQEFMRERNIRQKLAIQKEKDVIVEKRDKAWRDYDEKREELKKEKNKLIQSLYQLADQQIEIIDEFSIKWTIN